jgi:hypothetical protein
VIAPAPCGTTRTPSRTFSPLPLSIECEPCGRFGRYNVAKLIEQYGDAKLPDLRHVLANCPKAKSQEHP